MPQILKEIFNEMKLVQEKIINEVDEPKIGKKEKTNETKTVKEDASNESKLAKKESSNLCETKNENKVQAKVIVYPQKEKGGYKNIKFMKLKNLESIISNIKSIIKIKINNEIFYNYIKNGLNIPNNLYQVIKFEGNDNNFYRCLSFYLYGEFIYNDKLRKTIALFSKENINEINDFKSEIELKNGTFLKTKDYINNMDSNVIESKHLEIIISCFIFCINISIYTYLTDKTEIEYLSSYIYEENNINIPTMILIKEGNEQYNLIEYIKENEKTEIKPIEKSEEIKTDSKDIITTNQEDESLKEMVDNEYNDSDSDNFISTKEKKEVLEPVIPTIPKYLLKKIAPKEEYTENPYPKYKNYKDEDLYLNIYKFLEYGIKNKKRKFPDYVERIQDRELQNYFKLEFQRKVGYLKVSKTKLLMYDKMMKKIDKELLDYKFNEKDLYNCPEKYIIENKRLYVIRYEHMCVENKYKIPFANEIDDILAQCHDRNQHKGVKDTINLIKKKKLFWVSMSDDVKEYIKNCMVCWKNN